MGQAQVHNGIARYVTECTYYASGRFAGNIGWAFPDGSVIVRVAGTWEIEDGVLSSHVEQVSPANYSSLCPDSSNRIEFVDRNTWRLEGSDGVARRE